MAKQIAEAIDLGEYRRRKAGEAARRAAQMSAPMRIGGGFVPFVTPFAYFWMPVWIPVLMDGWSLPEQGTGDA